MNSNLIKQVYSKPVLTNLSVAQTEANKELVAMNEGFTMMNDAINGRTRGVAS
jgi:hypothetical protein